jgi:hypothetical protein
MAHPIENLLANVQDVTTLFELHVKQTGTKRGRRRGVEVLNRSALVLTTACWEAFVEDVVRAGADVLARRLAGPQALPQCVQRRLCAQLKEQKHELAIWSVAGRGWRAVLVDHVHDQVERFNTPRAKNVDDLVERCLGLERVSGRWSWEGMAVDNARKKLDDMVTLRGAVAHRVSAGASVHKREALQYAEFVQRLAAKTSNTTRAHLKKLTGRYPWRQVHVKAASEGSG